MHRDKLTPRFKANSPTRKLSARVGTYLSGLLHFLGVLEVRLRDGQRSFFVMRVCTSVYVGLGLYIKMILPLLLPCRLLVWLPFFDPRSIRA